MQKEEKLKGFLPDAIGIQPFSQNYQEQRLKGYNVQQLFQS